MYKCLFVFIKSFETVMFTDLKYLSRKFSQFKNFWKPSSFSTSNFGFAFRTSYSVLLIAVTIFLMSFESQINKNCYFIWVNGLSERKFFSKILFPTEIDFLSISFMPVMTFHDKGLLSSSSKDHASTLHSENWKRS